jgi:hypothetical protein
VAGFTTGSRGKLPGKTCEKRRRNNNNNNSFVLNQQSQKLFLSTPNSTPLLFLC